MPTGERDHKIGSAKRKLYLDLLAEGMPNPKILETVGWRQSGYRSQTRAHRDWHARVKYIRGEVRKHKPPEHRVTTAPFTFPEFVGRYFPDRRPHLPHQIQIADILEDIGPREIVLVLLWPAAGKGLATDTRLPTPDGITTMGRLQPGDRVYAMDGTPTHVSYVSLAHHRDCYRFTFDGGGHLTADDQHRWLVRSSKPRTTHVADTLELFSCPTVSRGTRRPNHSVPVIRPLQNPPAELPLDPYLLGVWLGDGATGAGRVTSVDPEIESAFVQAGFEISSRHKITFYVAGLRQVLRKTGVFRKKHIPDDYLGASAEQRWALLEGLMDTDGSCDKMGRCEFTTTKLTLWCNVRQLIADLGIKFSASTGTATLNGRDCGPKYRIQFTPDRYVFRLDRKAARQRLPRPTDRHRWRAITNIEQTHSVPTVCIKVEHPSETFVVYDDHGTPIVTHNTATIEDYICRKLALDPAHRFRYVSESSDLSKRIV